MKLTSVNVFPGSPYTHALACMQNGKWLTVINFINPCSRVHHLG